MDRSLSVLVRQGMAFIAAFSIFMSPIWAQQSNQQKGIQWVFPGDKLPGDNAILPLKVGSSSDSDVVVSAMDWFLLDRENLVYSQQVSRIKDNQLKAQSLGFVGPKLNSFNAQNYYRLVSGMILKETLVQMGLNSVEAKRYFESAGEKGLNFDKASLDEIGPLPAVLENLALNYKRPATRLALLPYLMTPMAIAYNQSALRHFYQGLEGQTSSNRCDNITQLAPLNEIHAQIQEKKSEIAQLDRDYLDAVALGKQSTLEKTRLTGEIDKIANQVDQKTSCLNEIKAQVESGLGIPSQKCLNLAEKQLTASGNQQVWKRFVNQNLSNQKGDFAVKEKARLELEAIQKKIEIKQAEMLAWNQKVAELESKLEQQNESLATLKTEETRQVSEYQKLAQDHETQKKELRKLQEINFSIENGSFAVGKSIEEINAAKAEIGSRDSRIKDLQASIPSLLEELRVNQSNQAAVRTQIDFLAKEIKSNGLTLTKLKNIKPEDRQIREPMSELKAQETELISAFNKAQDNYTFAEYTLSLLGQDVLRLNNERTRNFDLLEREKEASVTYQENIAALKTSRDDGIEKKQAELQALEAQIASHTSGEQMGWFLENDCDTRTSKANDVYLSRTPITNYKAKKGQKVPGGQWGLFSLNQDFYPNAMNGGLALNLPNYIQFAVKGIIDRYDFLTEVMFSDAKSCHALDQSNPITASYNLMLNTATMWQGGTEISKENSGFCKGSQASSFDDDLKKLIAFEGSLLDQTLPEVGVHSAEMTMEREALYWLNQEMQALFLNGSDIDIETRRDQLIKSLIKVLANNYTQELRESLKSDVANGNIQLATNAPGAELYQQKDIAVGSTQTVMTTGQVTLFSNPINKASHKTNQTVTLEDQVKVLAIADTSNDVAVKGNWLKVQLLDNEGAPSQESYWMPAWPVTYDTVVDINGQEPVTISSSNNEFNCPVARVVEDLENFASGDKQVTRLLPEIQVSRYASRPGWYMDWDQNKRTSPATIGKTYIACEYFSVDGRSPTTSSMPEQWANYKGVDYSDILGIRIVEAEKVVSASGATSYILKEEYGGFVHTWLQVRNSQRPRIILGEKLDTTTWSIEQ